MTLAMADATGASQAALHFAEWLIADGWRVTLACGPAPSRDGTNTIVPAMLNAHVAVCELDRLVAPTPPVWSRLRALAANVRPAAILGIMQRDRPVAMALSRALNVPGIVSAQNQHRFWGIPPVRVAKRSLYAACLRRWASMVICTSEPVRSEICTFGVPLERTTVLPNAIELHPQMLLGADERSRLRNEMGAGPTDCLILNVGRLDMQKGQDLLLDAFATFARSDRRLRLALVGDAASGSSASRTQAFAANLRLQAEHLGIGSQVRFAGWRADVRSILASADAYVHSARWEGWSLAVMEAMAARLPSVITDCSGRPDGFIDGTHGWVVRANDAEDLRAGLAHLLRIPREGYAQIGAAARTLVEERYSFASIQPRFVEIIANAVAAGR